MRKYVKSSFKSKATKGVSLLMCAAMLAGSGALVNPGRVAHAAGGDANYMYYQKDNDWRKVTEETNKQIAAEGMALLKNDGLLPLTVEKNGGEKVKVSVFGKHSVSITDRGFGSSDTFSGWGDFYGAFENAAYNKTFELNPALKAFYGDESKSGKFRLDNDRHGSLDNYRAGLGTWETPYSMYTDDVKASYADYSDAAIVVLSRYGGEGTDLPATSLKDWTDTSDANKLDSARSADSHYLQLDKNEVEMLQNVMDNFRNVIILVNSSNPIELGFINDPTHYLYTDNNYTADDESKAAERMSRLKAVMYIGFPGETGCRAIPGLLDGTINPSGHLADTWERNFMDNPVMQNFGLNGSQYGNRADKGNSVFVHYDEDIYVGYRYYETRYVEEENGDEWYANEVIYPFGYGLSYTQFDWELLSCESELEDGSLKKDGVINVSVKVTNSGDVAGKEVVQLYYNAPYTDGGIEKAHVVLADFAKTGVLKPGESETVQFKLDVSDMYSYDWSDANNNGFKGYELDAGTYNITVARNAHEAAKLADDYTTAFQLKGGFRYDKDTTTGNPVSNLFDDVSGTGKVNDDSFMGVRRYMSRSDFKATAPTPAADKKSVERYENTPTVDPAYDRDKPWYTDEMPKQAVKAGDGDTNKIKLWMMRDRDYDDPMWNALMDQLTCEEMAGVIGNASLNTWAIESIDKPHTSDWDGPLGRRNSGDIQWASNTLLAQTFNKELAYKQGIQFGNAALNAYGVGTYGMTYGVGLNIHRSHFGGRAFEYYSEDGLLSGMMAAKVIAGAWTKGNIQTVKHFVLNDQESSRNTVQTWASEQAIREIYARAFEIAVKDGGANALMAGVNSIGNTTCAESWALMTGLLRNEWGFKGFVITDMVTKNPDRCIRAGTDLMMSGGNEPKTDAASLTATQTAAIRRSIKNVLYVMANSAIIQGYGGEQLDYIRYGGPNTVYGVQGVDNTINVDKAENDIYEDSAIKYELLDGSTLPDGMSLSADGIITGAPAAAGEYDVSIVAKEDTEAYFPLKPKIKNYTIKVFANNEIPQNIIFEDDDLGVIPYGFEFSKSIDSAVAFDDNGKLYKDVKYSLTGDSALPQGLKLENGVISGVTTAEPGTYFFTVKAEMAGREPALLDFIVTVKAYTVIYPEAPALDDISVGDTVAINVGGAFASDGIDVKYALKKGSVLPEGLTLASNGVITGTATRACTDRKFTVVASADMANSKEMEFSLTVKGVVFDDVTFGDDVYGGLLIGKNYSFKLGAAVNDGSNSRVTYRVKEGSKLPYGFKLLADGTLCGNTDELGSVTTVIEAVSEGYVTAEAQVKFVFAEFAEAEPPAGDIAKPIIDGQEPEPKNNNTAVIVGVSVTAGVLVLAAGAVLTVWFIKKKKQNNK